MQAMYTWPTWMIVAGAVALTLLATALGYRAGCAHSDAESDRAHGVSTAIKGSILGLVALILGFTYSMTTSRYSDRQRVVLQEANAAGTCFLRAGLLAEPARQNIREALRRFVDVRLNLFDLSHDPEAVERNRAEIDRLLDQLWSAVEASATADPDRTRNSQIVPAANEVIDMSTTRMWISRNHVPPSVVLLLVVCMVVSGALTGESFGRVGRPAVVLWIVQILLIGMVLYVVLDFDRPHSGLIEVDHQPLIELKASMAVMAK